MSAYESPSGPQSLTALAEQHRALVEEAAEALPHQFSQCTYSLGPIRQAVYLCLTCAVPRGICSACSIACHTDHEQLELFPKRAFCCDCPTRALPHACTLHSTPEAENAGNAYGQNFRGVFCRCSQPYDAKRERETMVQCVACEDWFHESCLNLRERPPLREPTPEEQADEDDGASNASSELPPGLITADDYDSFVCGACVREIPTLRRCAGTPGALMVVRDAPEQPWKVIGREEGADGSAIVEVTKIEESDVGEKRARSPTGEGVPSAKRPRVSTEPSASPPCLAPPENPVAQKVLTPALRPKESDESIVPGSRNLGTSDVFLTEGWRERWCKCQSCFSSLQTRPYLLEEDETYSPPEDPDSGLTLEELGLRALQRLPRERAIDGIRAFNEMRDDLMNHLRPFAQEGKVVTEADIRAFFDARINGQQAS
ncbi:uncharacterized protein B0H18DRAFT_1014904 [Fomitopsis serialis]|uniref:uncharacterized protein n=1 Tax=Fomitopsis serialis TaxID=139415 RepID=UPI00200814F1|nr:uncharacterized protein B0H18DRAFT_1014904 [Neoantrodia serialis]KAH9923518.1 hypothetical protein B0H18DRAFT_1014904 [Neoantrodia serialis]